MATNPFQQIQPYPPTFRQGPQMGHAGAMRPNPAPNQMFGNFPQQTRRPRQDRPDQQPGGQAGGAGGYSVGATGQGTMVDPQPGGQVGGSGGYQAGPTGQGQNPFQQMPGGGFDEQPSATGQGNAPGYLWGAGAENPFWQPQRRAPGMGPAPSDVGYGQTPGMGNRTMMGQASPGGWSNPFSGMSMPMPSAGMVGGALGGMVGGLPGAFLGNRAGNWIGERFGQGPQLSDSPSPFMPEWLGGSGDSSLDGPQQFNMTAPENLRQFGPNGNPMSNMGSYRSGRGFATGSMTPGDMGSSAFMPEQFDAGPGAIGRLGERMYSQRR